MTCFCRRQKHPGWAERCTRSARRSLGNHTELAVYTNRCGTALSDEQIDTLLYYSEAGFSAVYLNLRMFSEHGVLPDRNSDISSIFTAAMIDPLPENNGNSLR